MPDLGIVARIALEAEGAVIVVVAVAIAAEVLLRWAWLKLVDSLPDPEPRRAARSKAAK